MRKLTVIGVGPGAADRLTLQARAAIDAAGIVFAAQRHAELASGQTVHDLKPFSVACERMESALQSTDVAVLVSGDPTQFSMTPLIRRRFADRADIAFSVLPGIGSIQSLFCHLAEPSQDAVLRSLHGRPFDPAQICALVAQNPLTVFLTDPVNHPARVSVALAERGFGHLDAAYGENLSYPDEIVWQGSVEALSQKTTGGQCVLRIRNATPIPPPVSPTLRDEDFTRGDRPMTKAEIRMLSACKLGLTPNAVVWDAGAGTGSVAIQCALLAPMGKVYAVEREPEGIALIAANARKLGAHNVVPVEGSMPDALADLPDPTHVFVGGSGGQLAAILDVIAARGPGIRVVLNAVTLKSAQAALQAFSTDDFTGAESIQVQVSRAGKAGILMAQNPVFILSAMTARQNPPDKEDTTL